MRKKFFRHHKHTSREHNAEKRFEVPEHEFEERFELKAPPKDTDDGRVNLIINERRVNLKTAADTIPSNSNKRRFQIKETNTETDIPKRIPKDSGERSELKLATNNMTKQPPKDTNKVSEMPKDFPKDSGERSELMSAKIHENEEQFSNWFFRDDAEDLEAMETQMESQFYNKSEVRNYIIKINIF